MTDRTLNPDARAKRVAAAGIAIIVLSAGAALLPLGDVASATVVGGLLLAAGLIEIGAASIRMEGRLFALAAGAITAAAGLLFLINRNNEFFSALNLVAVWLLVRSGILAAAAFGAERRVKMWVILAAATDLLLGLLLLAGLSISTLVVGVFGPTPQLVASFAWVFALSFVVTGLLLLQVASCERDRAG